MVGGYYDPSDQVFLTALMEAATAKTGDTGVISEYNLRFLKVRSPLSETIVFADMSSEKATLLGLAKTCAALGVLCLGGFLGIAVLLAAGTKGKRRVLPNAEVMIHQPLGGAEGQASDVLIRARHLERARTRLTDLLAEYTGRDRAQLAADMDRDNFMDAAESVAYGLADEVVDRRTAPSAA